MKIKELFRILLPILLISLTGCKKDPATAPEPSFRILDVRLTPSPVYLGASIRLEAVIYNPENDTLKFVWSASRGKLLDFETNPTTWIAPDSTGSAEIRLMVQNQHRERIDTAFTIYVGNQPPRFEGFVYHNRNVIIGNTLPLKCRATEPDGQELQIQWYSDGGVLTTVTKDSVVWQAPTIPGKYHIWVELYDGYTLVRSDTLELVAYREYGCIWVIERGNKSLKKFTDNGILLFEIQGFANPMAVRVNPRDKSCWVADASYAGSVGKIYRISFNGDTIRTIGNFVDPQDIGVYILEKDVWVVDAKQNTLTCISPIDFSIRKTITGFFHPQAVDIDQRTREVWVADTDNDRVVRISFDVPDHYNVNSDSGFHSIIPITDPVDISADQNDEAIWVAQRFEHQVTYIREGFTPIIIANLVQPMNVQTAISSGQCWISDTGKNRILKYSGNQLLFEVADGFLLPTKISLNIFDGSIWVLDSQNNRLVKITDNGQIEKYLVGLNEPWDISVNFGQ